MTPTFTWPTDSRVISSRFTDPRPYGLHKAINIVAPPGAPVRAVARGTVIFAGWAGSAGWSVWVDHAEGWRSHYCHLSLMRVRASDGVGHGYRIGDVGSTGDATGDHLHLNLFAPTKPATGLSAWVAWVGKWAVDPLDYLTEEDEMPSFEELAQQVDYLTKRRHYEVYAAELASLAISLLEKGKVDSARAVLRRMQDRAANLDALLGAGKVRP